MSIHKIRLFAGPNGSGKSSLFAEVNTKYNCGQFVNSDFIEKELKVKGCINLSDFQLSPTEGTFSDFLQQSTAVELREKAHQNKLTISISLNNNSIYVNQQSANSYDAACITSFIREELMKLKTTFSYETVFSHPEKLEELKRAKQLGYRIYLYFIAVDDVSINLQRIEERVAKGGHYVPAEKIISRYHNSLNNLLPALAIADRAFLFDNSDKEYNLVAETESRQLTISSDSSPNWFIKYIVNRL